METRKGHGFLNWITVAAAQTRPPNTHATPRESQQNTPGGKKRAKQTISQRPAGGNKTPDVTPERQFGGTESELKADLADTDSAAHRRCRTVVPRSSGKRRRWKTTREAGGREKLSNGWQAGRHASQVCLETEWGQGGNQPGSTAAADQQVQRAADEPSPTQAVHQYQHLSLSTEKLNRNSVRPPHYLCPPTHTMFKCTEPLLISSPLCLASAPGHVVSSQAAPLHSLTDGRTGLSGDCVTRE